MFENGNWYDYQARNRGFPDAATESLHNLEQNQKTQNEQKYELFEPGAKKAEDAITYASAIVFFVFGLLSWGYCSMFDVAFSTYFQFLRDNIVYLLVGWFISVVAISAALF